MKTDSSDKIKAYRGDKIRPKLKKRSLELLADLNIVGNVSTAAKVLGINRDTVYDWRAKDTKFARDWDNVVEFANDELSDIAESALLKAIRAGNTSAIIFTLKSRQPERWNVHCKHTLQRNETTQYKVSPEIAAMLGR